MHSTRAHHVGLAEELQPGLQHVRLIVYLWRTAFMHVAVLHQMTPFHLALKTA